MDSEALIKALPKLEQHVHIVGSTKPETLLWLVNDSGIDKPLKTLEDVKNFYTYRDFPSFLKVYSTVNDCIRKERQYERIVYEMLQTDASCNVRHVEAIFSANDHVRRGLSYTKMLDSINRAISRAKSDFGITCTVRVDLVRDYGPEVGMRVLDWIEDKGDNIVAIDIGGSEQAFPPELYVNVFKRAKEMGLRLVAHAGEVAGPESVYGAVEKLGVERIGHGIAVSRDPKLLSLLKERDVAIETCPISNLRTGAIRNIGEHPIKTFMSHGINVSVNSDDPPMFNTDMNQEYLALRRELGLSVQELFQISLDSIKSSFLKDAEKERLKKVFVREYDKLMN